MPHRVTKDPFTDLGKSLGEQYGESSSCQTSKTIFPSCFLRSPQHCDRFSFSLSLDPVATWHVHTSGSHGHTVATRKSSLTWNMMDVQGRR